MWEFLASMTPEELVSLVDFRYLTDALTPDEALAMLRAAEPGRAERAALLREKGYPAYTTSPGWLGYSDDEARDDSPRRPSRTGSARSSSRSAGISRTTSGG